MTRCKTGIVHHWYKSAYPTMSRKQRKGVVIWPWLAAAFMFGILIGAWLANHQLLVELIDPTAHAMIISYTFPTPTTIKPKPVQCPTEVILRQQIINYILCKDWDGQGNTAVAVAHAESGFDPEQKNLNDGHSLDRGVFQINQKYHSEVSNLCAFDAKCNIDAANRIFKANGSSFNQWSAYNNGSYLQFLP